MLLWLTCIAAGIICVYGFAALGREGKARENAIRVIAGTATSYMVIVGLLKI